MIQTNKNKNILRTDVGGGYSPITKTYQNIANNMGNQSNTKALDSAGDNTLQIYKDIASQMPSPNANTVPTNTPTPTTPANENSDIVKAYQESANRLLSEKEALDPNDKNYRIEADTYNSKIESTNELIKAYMQNSKDSISAKANAEIANQKAVNGTAAYLKALGLEGQGIAESTIADVNKNYANAMAGIEAQENENNSNAQNSYLEALKQANSERQARLDQKDLIEDERKYNDMKEAYDTYNNILEQGFGSAYTTDKYGNITGVNDSTLEEYKSLAEEYYKDGKISESQYDSIVRTYQEALKDYNQVLTDNGFATTTETPKGVELTERDTQKINDLMKTIGLSAKEGMTYDFNGKTVVYSNGKWKYLESSSKNDNGIPASTAKESDFSQFYDSGKTGSKQSIYVNTVLQAAKEGKIPDGTVIDFNYGSGVDTYYMYKNGNWYPQNWFAQRAKSGFFFKNNTTAYSDRTIHQLLGYKIDYSKK